MAEETKDGIIQIDLNERLHVDIGAFCNNNCLFCMEEDRAGRLKRVGAITPEQIRTILQGNSFRREVMFVSGEPTLNPNFLEYVELAHNLSYESVGVITNGRRFSYQPFAEKALRAGLNLVIISIHGPNPRIHDGLTRTPGTFVQALKGIRNLASLRERFGLRLNTSTVLNRRNATPERLDELHGLLGPLVDQMVFNIMQPFGRGNTHFDSLMMRYVELADVLGRFFAHHAGTDLPIYLVDIPYCTTEGRGIPDRSRGYVERYVHFEPDHGDSGLGKRDSDKLLAGGAAVKIARLGAMSGTTAAGHGPRAQPLKPKHRDLQEQDRKAKRDECRQCAYFNQCDGVWLNYLDKFGFDEFEPVQK